MRDTGARRPRDDRACLHRMLQRPVRLLHVPAMWPRSPRQVRTSSQCELTSRSCHAGAAQGGTQIFDRFRPFVTSLHSRPRLRIDEQRAQLVDEIGRRRARAVERLDLLESPKNRARLVHEVTVDPSRSRVGNPFDAAL
jgi:hypothetical protein